MSDPETDFLLLHSGYHQEIVVYDRIPHFIFVTHLHFIHKAIHNDFGRREHHSIRKKALVPEIARWQILEQLIANLANMVPAGRASQSLV